MELRVARCAVCPLLRPHYWMQMVARQDACLAPRRPPLQVARLLLRWLAQPLACHDGELAARQRRRQ